MKTFQRQKSANTTVDKLKMNLRAASAQVARVFEPEFYKVRIEAARIVVARTTGNVLVALDVIETASSAFIAIQPLWIGGPNANAGRLVAENQALLAQLLELANQDTDGEIDVAELVPKLAGLVFDARLALATDSRTGRTFNVLAEIFPEGAS
jgi:hypothetical protein